MSNNIFDIQRFGKLIKRHWFNRTFFSLRALTLLALPLLPLLLNLNNSTISYLPSDRANSLMSLLRLVILLSPLYYFRVFNHPKKGITEVMLPASSLEKFLIMQITAFVFVPLYFFVPLISVDTLLSLLFPKVMGGYAVAEFVKLLNFNWEQVVIFFVFCQLMTFCNLWFTKNKMAKTMGIYIAFIIIGLVLLKLFIVNTNFINKIDSTNFHVDINGNGSSLLIRAGDNSTVVITQLLRIFIDIIMPIGLTIGSYFMLKTRRY